MDIKEAKANLIGLHAGFCLQSSNTKPLKDHWLSKIINLLDDQEKDISNLEKNIEHLEELRPEWAQGYTSDSMAAQYSTDAKKQLWKLLGAEDQTQAVQAIRDLKRKELR